MDIRACVSSCVAVATGPRAYRTVPCSNCDKGAALLGGLRQLTLRGMHASACSCALGRLPIRTVRHTVASHDMQQIDLCEADSMLADNVAPELLLPQHEA